MRVLLLSALLAISVNALAEDTSGYVKPVEGTAQPGTVQVRVPKRPAWARTPTPETPAAAPVNADNPQGLPMIPASNPDAATPAPAVQAAATPASSTPNSSGLVPGQPATTYATMAQAAKAGVDPFRETTVAKNATSTSAPAPVPATKLAFEVSKPATWLPWVKANSGQASKFALIMLGVLALAGLAFKVLTRHSAQD